MVVTKARLLPRPCRWETHPRLGEAASNGSGRPHLGGSAISSFFSDFRGQTAAVSLAFDIDNNLSSRGDTVLPRSFLLLLCHPQS